MGGRACCGGGLRGEPGPARRTSRWFQEKHLALYFLLDRSRGGEAPSGARREERSREASRGPTVCPAGFSAGSVPGPRQVPGASPQVWKATRDEVLSSAGFCLATGYHDASSHSKEPGEILRLTRAFGISQSSFFFFFFSLLSLCSCFSSLCLAFEQKLPTHRDIFPVNS